MTLPKFFRLLVVAAILIGAAVLLGSIGWPQPDRTREFCAVILAAILTSAFAIPRSTAEDRGMMTPPFVDSPSWSSSEGHSPIRTARVHYADCWSTPAAS